MFNWFKSKTKSASREPIYDMSWITLDEADNYPDGIREILDHKRDGFVVTDFMTEEEAAKIMAGYYAVPDEKLIKVNPGFNFYPRSFAQMEQGVQNGEITEESYHQEAVQFRDTFEQGFGVDLTTRVRDILEKLGPKAHVPADQNGYGAFMPYTIRELKGGGAGQIKVHCGHFFFNEFPSFFDRFRHFTDNDHQLSFFVVLQPPTKGGELTLYGLRWDDAHERPDDSTLVRLKDGARLDLENPKSLPLEYISPKAGSLVIFNGGDIWHRVEDVQGESSRFTIGGFLSLSPDREDIYFWS